MSEEHIRRVAEDLNYAAQYGGKLERPASPPVFTRAWVEREIERLCVNIGKFIGKAIDPLDKRIAALEKSAGKNSLKHAAAHDLYANMVERVSKLEAETSIRFMGIWQPGFYYEKGCLSPSMAACGTPQRQRSTRPGTGEGAGKGPGDWQLCVARQRWKGRASMRTLVETYELIARVHRRTAQAIGDYAEQLEERAAATRASLVKVLRSQGRTGAEIDAGLESARRGARGDRRQGDR